MDDGKKARPGKLIGSLADFECGENTHVYLGQIYASTSGTIKVTKQPGAKSKVSVWTVAKTQLGQPMVGQEVFARITRVEERFAKAEIVALCNMEDSTAQAQVLKTTFQGIIFRENVRSFDHESVDLA